MNTFLECGTYIHSVVKKYVKYSKLETFNFFQPTNLYNFSLMLYKKIITKFNQYGFDFVTFKDYEQALELIDVLNPLKFWDKTYKNYK